MTKTKLIPCPFCGGVDIVISEWPITISGWYVLCKTCGANINDHAYTGAPLKTKEAAIKAWNTRAEVNHEH